MHAINSITIEASNLKVFTMEDALFSNVFGISTTDAVIAASDFGLEAHDKEILGMYDGYSIRGQEDTIINTWSLLNYLNDVEQRPYWVEVGSTRRLLEKLVWNASIAVKETLLMILKNGHRVTNAQTFVPVLREVQYGDVNKLDTSDHTVWSLLYYYGYLTTSSPRTSPTTRDVSVRIPNMEVHSAFDNLIKDFFPQSSLLDDTIRSLFNPTLISSFEKHLKILYTHSMR